MKDCCRFSTRLTPRLKAQRKPRRSCATAQKKSLEGFFNTAGYEPFIEGLKLPDLNDRHVLATAIHCKAQVIVTYNLKDFPKENLHVFEVEAQHPDLFLRHIIDLVLPRFLEAVKEIREASK